LFWENKKRNYTLKMFLLVKKKMIVMHTLRKGKTMDLFAVRGNKKLEADNQSPPK